MTTLPPDTGARTPGERARLYLEAGKIRLDTLDRKNNRLLDSTGWDPADERWRLYCRYLQDNYLEAGAMLTAAAAALEQAIRADQTQTRLITLLLVALAATPEECIR